MKLKINKEESLKRVMAAMPSEEEMEKASEEYPVTVWTDSDLVVMYGTLLAAKTQGHDVDIADLEKEFMRRAGIHVTQMLMAEGLLAMEEDNGKED